MLNVTTLPTSLRSPAGNATLEFRAATRALRPKPRPGGASCRTRHSSRRPLAGTMQASLTDASPMSLVAAASGYSGRTCCAQLTPPAALGRRSHSSASDAPQAESARSSDPAEGGKFRRKRIGRSPAAAGSIRTSRSPPARSWRASRSGSDADSTGSPGWVCHRCDSFAMPPADTLTVLAASVDTGVPVTRKSSTPAWQRSASALFPKSRLASVSCRAGSTVRSQSSAESWAKADEAAVRPMNRPAAISPSPLKPPIPHGCPRRPPAPCARE